MSQQQTAQAHNNLKNVLLNGRILINGLPLTANELSGVLQGEQLLFEKASKLDAANALAIKQKELKDPKKKSNIIPLKQPEKKECSD